jgi:hypothetical protein
MSKLILQQIADDIQFDGLPVLWREFDLKYFSKEKNLYDFQEKSLENALKVLWYYYGTKFGYKDGEKLEINYERKAALFKLYQDRLDQDLSYDLTEREGKKTAHLLEEYYSAKNGKIGFENFINRMAFWMATGSGKTLVIVKLIELIKKLVLAKEIPENDILFLTYREDLIEQFKEYIKEFNDSHDDIYINLKSLKDYDSVKRETPTLFKDKEITIFYYRSDLISDESKEKIVDFRNYDNNGRWYILLDEAHKGDKEESKRQILYSILSRNGFLFNFSATFVDPRDFITTAFNFNLVNFIQDGYGKYIYLSQEEIKAFKKDEDFSEIDKRKIVLKSLILLTYIRKFSEKIKSVRKDLYHNPLLLTLVNSVNVEDADLKLFFEELEKIGQGQVDNRIFEEARRELENGFEAEKKMLIPEDRNFELDKKLLAGISFEDVLNNVFNSKSAGNIEVLTIPGNRQEMVFKLRTSEKPFALIKIGDIAGWLKNQLEGYEINESFDNESVFGKINRDDSDINILMGSRSFYEGWDSNRPNIILFINIGVGSDARKFVLQSVGRGVRIEPVKNQRKRLNSILPIRGIEEGIANQIKNYVLPIETLFVFGTNAGALRETANTLLAERGEEFLLENKFVVNKKVQDLPLYIPVYRLASYTFAEREKIQKFPICSEDLSLCEKYIEFLGDDRVVLMNHDCDIKTLKAIKESFKNKEEFYKSDAKTAILNPDIIISQLIRHFSLVPEEFERFKRLEEEIVHFKKIKFFGKEKLSEFLENLDRVRFYEKREEAIKQLRIEFEKDRDIEKYDREKERIDKNYLKAVSFDGIKIKYIQNHYYIPVVLSDQEKIEYLNHIINVPSEVKFIKNLEQYLGKENNGFNGFDWWIFSKIDPMDSVYLPYYNRETHSVDKFKPDFIFWLKKNKSYAIAFIDPKSRKYTDYQDKVDWYKRLFENKAFVYDDYEIRVFLFLATDDVNQLSDSYREYWFDNIEKMIKKINNVV